MSTREQIVSPDILHNRDLNKKRKKKKKATVVLTQPLCIMYNTSGCYTSDSSGSGGVCDGTQMTLEMIIKELYDWVVQGGSIKVMDSLTRAFYEKVNLLWFGKFDSPEIHQRVCSCLTSLCGIEEEESAAWALWYTLRILSPIDETLMSKMQLIPKLAKSSRLKALAYFELASGYGRLSDLSNAAKFSKLQFHEAEMTDFRFAKMAALQNLYYTDARNRNWVMENLGSMSDDDPICKCLFMYYQALFVYKHGKGRLEKNMYLLDIVFCLERSIAIFTEIEAIAMQSQIIRIEDFQSMNAEAKKMYDKTMKLVSQEGLLHEIDNKITDCHRRIISGRDDDMCKGVESWNLFCDTKFIHKLSKSLDLHIVDCLQSKYNMEKEETEAWASYYYATALPLDNMDVCGTRFMDAYGTRFMDAYGTRSSLLKQSLEHGKSPILKYLASYELLKCHTLMRYPQSEDHYRVGLSYRLQNLEAVKSMTTASSHTKIESLHYLVNFYNQHGQFREAKKRLSEIEDMCQPGDLVTEGLILFHQGIWFTKTTEDSNEEVEQIMKLAIRKFQQVQFSNVIPLMRLPAILTFLNCLKMQMNCQIPSGCFEEEEFERLLKWVKENGLIHIPRHHQLYRSAELDILLCKASIFDHRTEREKARSTYLKALKISRKTDVNYVPRILWNLFDLADNKEEQERYLYEAEQEAANIRGPQSYLSVLRMAFRSYMGTGQHDKAYEKVKALLQITMNLPQQLDKSMDRISYIDNYRRFFLLMEAYSLKCAYGIDTIIIRDGWVFLIEDTDPNIKTDQVFVLKDTLEPLLWVERAYGRDFLYSIEKKPDRASYSIHSSEFDGYDDKASAELNSVLELAGPDTVFIVFSYRGTYFLRAGCDTLFMVGVFKTDVLMDSILPKDKDRDRMPTKPAGNWQQVLQALFQPLMGKWEPILEKDKTKRIIIVPNEQTSGVPFAALICSDGRYLIEKYEVCVAGSLRLFKYYEMRRCHLAKQKRGRALVVANPTKNLRTKNGQTLNLPFAEEEGAFVRDSLEKAGLDPEFLVGDSAKVDKVLTTSQESCWIHMACHTKFSDQVWSSPGSLMLVRGQFYDTMCELGALELADDQIPEDSICNVAERDTRSNTNAKNLLTAEKICEGKEIKAAVTVLGACSSGAGQRCAEGTLGLTRAFHFAGVPTVVASLWPIDDAETKTLMEIFYAKVIQEKLPIPTALREAMISLVQNTHPIHWAPFFVSGSPNTTLSDVIPPIQTFHQRAHFRQGFSLEPF